MSEPTKCPVTGRTSKPVAGGGTSNQDWWPNQLNLKLLHQHSSLSDPMGTVARRAVRNRRVARLALQAMIRVV